MVQEITAKSLLRRAKKIDSWFLLRAGMNLYRGCAHDCAYCDGRAETYRVEGEFGREVQIKRNAVELLRRELHRPRAPLPRSGFLGLVGGVGDCYQPAEERVGLTRRVLELLLEENRPVHILTKSTLVLRDIDLLARLAAGPGAVVSMSLSSVSARLSAVFEPGVPPPAERLTALAALKRAGVPTGVYLMPVLPFLSDTPHMLTRALHAIRAAGVDFVIFGGMTLKIGRQSEHFLRVLADWDPGLPRHYLHLYGNDRWGGPREEYQREIHRRFALALRQEPLAVRMPLELFEGKVDETDRVIVLLEHIDYFLRLRGERSGFSYAAWRLGQLRSPLCEAWREVSALPGVSRPILAVVEEIMAGGGAALYERLRRSIAELSAPAADPTGGGSSGRSS